MLARGLAAVIVKAVPVEVDRSDAARRARAELLKPEYLSQRPSLMQRLMEWLGNRLSEILSRAGGGRAGWVAFAVLVAIGVVVLLLVWRASRAAKPSQPQPGLFDPDQVSTAEQHRQQAQTYAQQQQWDLAVREQLRAIARHIEQLGVLQPQPGRTATEIAQQAGRSFSTVKADLEAAVHCFEQIWYGKLQARAEHYQQMIQYDQRVSSQRWHPETHPSYASDLARPVSTP